jgi:hypothetical protein
VEDNVTLSFPEFWAWLINHPNCVLRAGSPEAVLYDEEELHWHFTAEGPEMFVVQLLRGKRLLGELLVAPEQISFVNGTEGDREGEFLFELVQETEDDRFVAYFFIMAHGLDHESQSSTSRVH